MTLEGPLSSKGTEGKLEGRALEVPHDLTTPLDAHRQEGPDPTLTSPRVNPRVAHPKRLTLLPWVLAWREGFLHLNTLMPA